MKKNDEPAQFELQIGSTDEATIKQIESSLHSVEVKRWPAARMDPVTVLAIATAGVKLISALLELKAKLAAQSHSTDVKVLNAAGATLNLATATEPAIKEFITGGG
jgi:hypothetical protein